MIDETEADSSASALVEAAVRLLYLPNEGHGNGRQEEGRAGLAELLDGGELASLEILPFWEHLERAGSAAAFHRELLEAARRTAATVVLWQHPTTFPVDRGTLDAIRALPSRPIVVYDERDPYYGIRKPLPSGGRSLALGADIISSSGLGRELTSFPHSSRRKIIYSPTCVQKSIVLEERVGTAPDAGWITMIASLDRYALPVISMPGTRQRLRLADSLYERFGKGFRVYGGGWPSRPYVQGRLPYDEQVERILESSVTVAWDRGEGHWGYFSDRLPIAMLTGVPHVTNEKAGFDVLFRNGIDLWFSHTVAGITELVAYLMSLPVSERRRLGAQQRDHAMANLTAGPVFRRLLARAVELRGGPAGE